MAKSYIRVELLFNDSNWQKFKTHGVYLPATSASQAEGWALAYATLIRNIIDVEQSRIEIYYEDYDRTQKPQYGANVQDCGVFCFHTDTAGKKETIVVPSLNPIYYVPEPDPWAGIQIDTTNTHIDALVAGILDNSDGLYASDYERNHLTTLATAYRQYRITDPPLWQSRRY